MSTIQGPECHSFGVRGYGDPSFGVVLVGISPGRDEVERTRRPFTGSSGQLLDSLLAHVGWSRDKVYATNTVCYQNNSPSEDELALCRERFQRELRLMAPKLIITAGATANEAVTGMKRRTGSRGSVSWHPRWNAYVLDTHHPSFALQAQSMDACQDIIRDFDKIERILGWPRGDAPDAPNVIHYDVITSLSHGQYVLNNLPHDTHVTLDIETSNPDDELIDAYSDQLLCFSIAYNDVSGREKVWVFPRTVLPECVRAGTHAKSHRAGQPCGHTQCPDPTRARLLEFPTQGVRWTFQGGQYDIPAVAEKLGVRLPLVDDTLLMSYCSDERPGRHGLKPMAREYFAAGYYNDKVKPFYKGKMNLLKDEDLNEYNAKDAAYDLRLVPIFTQRMALDETDGVYKRLLVPAINTFIDMSMRGINVNQKRLQELAYDTWFPRYLETYTALQQEAQDIGWPTDDINLNSNPQLAKFFYQICSQPIQKRTKKSGRPSVDKEALDRMDHPFAAKLRAYRTLDTMIDYVLSVYANLKYDGLLHPSAYVTSTRTGRTSYRDPAMQTIPKDYTVGADYARLREIIIPHNPQTHGLMEADYNQIEVWLCWHHCQDKVLLEHLRGGDVHSATAEGAFNTKRELHSELEWQELRQNAKKIRFGLMYGEGAEGLSRPKPVGIGQSKAVAQRYLDNFWNTYPEHRAWTLRTQHLVTSQGYIRSGSGRVMRFPVLMDHKALRQAVNFPIQVDASDYALDAMIELAPKLAQLNSYIILDIHDALAIEYDLHYEREVAELVRDTMQKPRIPGYPSVKVDVKIGPNLGQMRKYSFEPAKVAA